jgi:hypothetical protein
MEKITVSLRFEYYPEQDHEELFEDMTEERMVEYCKELAYDDILNGDVWEWLEVSVE